MKMNSSGKFVLVISLLVAFGYLEAACPSSDYTPLGGKCLKAFPDTEATWEGAKTACESEDAHLAYFNDCRAMHLITSYLTGIGPSASKYWVGASNSGEENKWIWLDNSDVQLGVPFWGTSTPGWTVEPNGEGEDVKYCAAADEDDQFYLHDEDCALTLNYICEVDPFSLSETTNEDPSEHIKKIEATVECPTHFEEISGSCFYFHFDSRDDSTKTSFTEAQSICEENSARLATFEDCRLFSAVVAFINANSDYQLPEKASYWIGARDDAEDGEYTWIGGYSTVFLGAPYWGSSNSIPEPSGGDNQNCALLYRDNQYYLHDGECYKKAYPLCQYVE